MSLGTLRQRPIRRRWIFGAITASLIATVALLVSAAGGTLPTGSTFDTFNGSLTSTTKHDWNPKDSPAGNLGPVEPISCGTVIPGGGANCGLDLTKSTSDDALGQGTKEDDTNVSVVDGSIPNNKDDLSRFYINSEKKPCVSSPTVNCGTSSVHQFLYMAWERTSTLGSAHMDFEFNQVAVGITTTSSGAVALNRTLGDLLVDFDFGGSGVPVLALHRWIQTSTPSTDCEAVSSGTNVLCWSKGVTLTTSCTAAPATPCAEASVNGVNVTDNNPPSAPRTLSGVTTINNKNVVTGIDSTFGEAGIDLTAANVFPANKCFHLGDAWLKSRSSGNSFGSELKDFIAPIPINISNCGEIKIIKHSDPRGIDQDFGFTSNIPNPTGTVTPDSQPYCLADNSPSAFTLNDDSGTDHTTTPKPNTEDCVNVLSADSNGNTITYHVTETTPLPAGFVLSSLTCTAGPNSSGARDGTTTTANITVAPGETVTCTYVDQQQLGAIKITKTSSKTAATPLKDAVFELCTNAGPYDNSNPCSVVSGAGSLTTGDDGTVCKDNLGFNDYYVHEKTAPSGYAIDNGDGILVTVNNNAKCSDATFIGETITFTDTPLTDLTVHVASEATGGTQSNVSCVTGTDPATGTAIGNSPQPASGNADPVTLTADPTHGAALTPGTYTCTIVIDP
jgi:Prealbumin-like fold domain